MKNDISDDLLDTPSQSGYAGPGFLTILWRRKALVFFGLMVGIVGGWIYYMQRPPVYQSSAQLMVMKRRAEVMPSTVGGVDSRVSFVDDYVATQEALIKSHIVLRRAAKHLEAEALHITPPGGDYIGFIASGLSVARPKDSATGASTNVLTISFRGPSPEDCALVVNAVIEGYRESIDGGVRNVTDDNLKQIVKSRADTEKQLKESTDTLQKIHVKISDASPVPVADLTARIVAYETKRSELLQRKIELESRLKLIQKGIDEGQDRQLMLALLEVTSPTRKERSMTETPRTPDEALFNLQLQEEEMKQRLGKDHPELVALRKRKEMIQEFMAKQALPISKDNPAKPKADPLELYQQFLKQEVSGNELQSDLFKKMLEDDRKVVQKLDESIIQQKLLKDRCDYLTKQLETYDERKRLIDLTRDAPLFDASVITPAATGGKVSPVLASTLGLAGFLGLVIGAGLAYLSEITDKSFRSVDEVRKRLGLPVIGQIPVLTPHEPSEILPFPLDPVLVAHHAPKSVQSEAYRGVRTSLFFSTRGKGHQVIQLTSPNPGDGKSTLAANLAVVLAHSGKRVILIDADFRKPRVHTVFGLAHSEIGLASVIAGEAELEAAIQQCAVSGLSILPCGTRPANPADLLTSAQFSNALDEIKKEYDFVLIDTPPLLAVSDPSVVAPRVDGVILTIRMAKNGRPSAEQAKERLGSLGAKVLGVVVNWTENEKGSYDYGYGYGSDVPEFDPAYAEEVGAESPVKNSR